MPDSQGFPWDLIGEYVSKTPRQSVTPIVIVIIMNPFPIMTVS